MKLFQWVKEIRSQDGVLVFKRYAIFQTTFLSLYVHFIYQADKDKHLHNHPWNFLTMVLRGKYYVMLPNSVEIKRPGSLSFMTRKGYHKIAFVVGPPVVTLFLAVGKWTPWGYDVDGKHIDSVEYRTMKNENKL